MNEITIYVKRAGKITERVEHVATPDEYRDAATRSAVATFDQGRTVEAGERAGKAEARAALKRAGFSRDAVRDAVKEALAKRVSPPSPTVAAAE